MNQMFSIIAQSYTNFKNQSDIWVCGHLSTSSTSGLPWWISYLQGCNNWTALRKFILEERSCRATIDITTWKPLTWPINHTFYGPGHKREFSFKVTPAQSEQRAKFQSKNITSPLLEGTLPQLWDGFIQLTLGYGHLSLRAPLCREHLNHIKDNQPNNTRKLGGMNAL